MKKTLSIALIGLLLTIALPLTASAQKIGKRNFKKKAVVQKHYQKEDKNIYDKHRNVFNIAIGTGAGALIGALLGGKKGALIGAGVGAGAGAAYTYGINPKDDDKKKRKWNRRHNNRRNQ